MRPVIGAWRPKSSSRSIELPIASLGGAVWFCVATGIAAVVIDMVFRFPLHLPGHLGLAGMALLVMARCVAGRAWGASLSGASSAVVAALPFATLPASAPLFFLLSGLVIDASCLLFPAWRDRVWFLAIAAGLANGSKAIGLWLIGGGGGGHGNAMVAGLGVPLLSHVAFGLCGGLIAAQLWAATKKQR